MSGEGRVVCVTGGSGYIASWIIHHLLLRGYTVKATLRNPDDPKARKHLFGLDGAKERLQLFKADLMDQGSFDQAVAGCEGVFHTASPIILSPSDPQAELIDPALKGTLNVLESCAKVATIKRVVVTSSIAAVMFTGKPLAPDVVIDETWFSDPVICKEKKLWYPLAKALAEDAAWRFAKEHKINMVTINPGLTLGPLLLPYLSMSVEIVSKHINAGAETFPDDYMKIVDVRDVANAHILAFERPSASGRYCLVANVKHFSELLKIVHEKFPTLQLPEKCAENPLVSKYDISKEKAQSLGIDFIPLEVTMKDTIESLKENGFL